MKSKKNELIILHPLQINVNRVKGLVNCFLDYLQDTDISPSRRLEVSINDINSCLEELEKLRVNLCDFRSELRYAKQALDEEDLPF